jgi:hypothetical protein
MSVRVYNVSTEKMGEGIPLKIDYSGRTYLFQPSDATWEYKKTLSQFIDRGQQMVSTSKKYSWVKKEENDTPNYLDVPASMSSWLFQAGMIETHKGILKTGTEMQDVVEQQLKKKQAALEAVEKELEIAEKKAASKKKPKSRSTTKLYSDVQA